MNRVLRTLFATACVAVALPAQASSSTTASIGGLLVTLTDLNPGDGIAPSITFSSYGQAYVAATTRSWGDEFEQHDYEHYASTQHGELAGAVHDAYASANVSVTAADTVAGFTAMSLSGRAQSAPDGMGAYFATASGAYPSSNYFTLSANTKVTFSAQASYQVDTSIGYNLEADQGEYAEVKLYMALVGATPDGQDFLSERNIEDGAYFSVRDDGTTTGQSHGWSGLMSVDYSNDSDGEVNGVFNSQLSMLGQSAVGADSKLLTAVPEADTYVMLLAGLALAGTLARRRRDAGALPERAGRRQSSLAMGSGGVGPRRSVLRLL